MEVRSFILTTGQEMIAQLVQENPSSYVIRNPLVAHMMRGADGQPTLGFAPWYVLHADNQDIELFSHALISKPVEIEPDVSKSYIENTTGVALPPSQGNILLG